MIVYITENLVNGKKYKLIEDFEESTSEFKLTNIR